MTSLIGIQTHILPNAGRWFSLNSGPFFALNLHMNSNLLLTVFISISAPSYGMDVEALCTRYLQDQLKESRLPEGTRRILWTIDDSSGLYVPGQGLLVRLTEPFGIANDPSENMVEVNAHSHLFDDKTVGSVFTYYDVEKKSLVLPFRFQVTTPFHESRAIIHYDNKYGVIDRNGFPIIPPKYAYVERFSENVTSVSNGNAYAVFDSRGKQLTNFSYFSIGPSKNNIIKVQLKKGSSFSFIDKNGKSLFAGLSFTEASDFHEGLAAVKFEDSLWGYINTSGHLQIAPRFINVSTFSEGLAVVQDQNLQWFLLKPSGETKPIAAELSAKMISASPFSEGLSRFSTPLTNGVDLYGYMNTEGEMAIPAIFSRARLFKNGIAFVSDKYGTMTFDIDKKGQVVPFPKHPDHP